MSSSISSIKRVAKINLEFTKKLRVLEFSLKPRFLRASDLTLTLLSGFYYPLLRTKYELEEFSVIGQNDA